MQSQIPKGQAIRQNTSEASLIRSRIRQILLDSNRNTQRMVPTTPSRIKVSGKTWILPERKNRYNSSVWMEYEYCVLSLVLILFEVVFAQVPAPDRIVSGIYKHHPPTYFQTFEARASPIQPKQLIKNVHPVHQKIIVHRNVIAMNVICDDFYHGSLDISFRRNYFFFCREA